MENLRYLCQVNWSPTQQGTKKWSPSTGNHFLTIKQLTTKHLMLLLNLILFQSSVQSLCPPQILL